MDEKEIAKTDTVYEETVDKKKKKFLERRSSWYILGILLALLIVFIGAIAGIQRGINQRVNLAETQAAPKIQSQLMNAKQDIEEGRYEVALDRLDWHRLGRSFQ